MVESDQKLLLTLQRRNDELSTLVEIGKALASQLGLADVLNVIMEKVSLLLRSDTWSLLLTDERTGELTFEIAVSPEGTDLKGLRLAKGEGIAGKVAETGKPLLIGDVRKSPFFSPQIDRMVGKKGHSIICVPLKSKNRVLGVIELIHTENKQAFSEDDLPILTTIADYVAIAIENARYYDRINQLIITDDLTGLFNSRHFNELIIYETERALRYDTDLSLVFFDLDRFKVINDTHGHLVGSRILSEVGGLILRHSRKVNHAARYGGDEFVILLPSTNKEGALKMAGALLEVLRAHTFTADDGTTFNLTASFGVATLPSDTRDRRELVYLADKAMYEVKASGRNAVCGA